MGSRDLRLTYIDHDAREVVINLVFPLNSFSLSTQVYAYYFIVLLLITLKRNNDYYGQHLNAITPLREGGYKFMCKLTSKIIFSEHPQFAHGVFHKLIKSNV